MKIQGIHHCSIIVSDMERAIHFYRDVLGLQEIGIPSTFKPRGLRVRWFLLGDYQHLHLMPAPEPDTISPRHLAIEVDDIQATREYLQSQGVEIREEVPIPGAERFFIADPEGNNIELIHWHETYHIVPLTG